MGKGSGSKGARKGFFKCAFFYLNGKKILFEDIIENTEKFYVSDEEFLIIDFCRKWLSDVQNFTLQTSGSTGAPKQITLTRKQMEISAKDTVINLKLNQRQKALICINTNYIGGMMMLVRGLINNWLMVITTPTSNPLKNNYLNSIPEIAFRTTTPKYKLDFAAFVPLQLQTILTETPENKVILDNMDAIIVGGAAFSETQEKLFKTINAPVYQTYGMTETVSHIALRRLNPLKNLMPNTPEGDYFITFTKVQIRTDERGCLVINAPCTNFKDVVTNDLVETIKKFNRRYYFKILGRIDNIINSGGVKIQLEKIEKNIENALSSIDLEDNSKKYSAKSFYCMGLSDETLGQRLVIVFEGESMPKIIEKKLLSYLKENLSKYEIPKEIIYKTIFERTETGKIIRK